MYCILNDTLARALIQTGKKNGNDKIARNTLAKRQAAVRLIALNPLKFEEIAAKYKNEFLCKDMMDEVRVILVSYYNRMETYDTKFNPHSDDYDDYVQCF